MTAKAIFVHSAAYVPRVKEYLSSHAGEEFDVWALGVDVELALHAEGIAYRSGRALRTTRHTAFISFVEKLGRSIFEDPSLSFLSYRGVAFKDIFINGFQNYLLELLYFLDAVVSMIEQGRYAQVVLFYTPGAVPRTAGVFAPFGWSAPLDATQFACAAYGLELVLPLGVPSGTHVRNRVEVAAFSIARTLFGWMLGLLNAVVTYTVPRKKIRIVASDYWRNIYPLLKELPEAEVLLLDRGELRKAGLAALWKHRVRFIHIENFLSIRERYASRRRSRALAQRFERAREENRALQEAEFRSHRLAPLILPVLNRVCTEGVEDASLTIDGAYAMLERLRPDMVWVRASVSAQIHFPILCYVARALGIPSLEAQHGIFYHGEGSFFNRIPAEYIATYGLHASEELKRFGFTDDRLLAVGSPRFDIYAKPPPSRPDPKHFTVACIMPAVLPQSWSDTYEIAEYLRGLRESVANIPNARLILKLRPGPDHGDFFSAIIEQELHDVPHRVVRLDPVVEVFAQADVVVSIYSTTVLEALISGKPVVYGGIFGMHDELGKELASYAKAGALRMTGTVSELKRELEQFAASPEARAAQVARAHAFMQERFAFDGRASQKLADNIRHITLKPQPIQPVL